ncbi:Disintegrin and metalloproteinase domain-containing protein 10 [Papilio machaon]|uniref:Disintegrin and metalloproteinase domain-containing protein 10 n=1 Tax=Papilio machaon TaxID=76193 RepID=A0A194QRR6_PAPMA|nr:Disintegrin and metalloproteinase domain-containing protein 10 [Papilio machaon]
MACWLIVYTCQLVFGLLVQGLDVQGQPQKGHSICSSYGYQLVEGIFGKETFWLCLKLKSIGSSPLANQQTALLVDPEPGDIKQGGDYTLADITMAYGFPVEDPAAGSAEGYIGEDHQFYGVLHLGNRTLHADPYGKDNLNKSFGAFENDHMAAPARPRRDHTQTMKPIFPYQIEEHSKNVGIATARICDLLLLADKEFFEKDANSSLNHVVRRMMHAVAQADIIFRNADFDEDGIPDNIGFSVKYILVLTSNETNARVFGDLLKDRAVDGRNYLMRFARLRRLSEVCLGVAFSGHVFHNRTLGLSFGAHHDDNFPNPECRGYLMGSQSSTTESIHHFEFSLCSKRLIAATLSSMSYCLIEQDRPYCGNGVYKSFLLGIVEEGEACDCGLPSHCSQRDPCCTPRAGGALVYEEGALHKEGCSVAPTASCHPSQGLCCNADCQYADLKEHGIGGALGEQHMCGVCCRLQHGDSGLKCVGAEIAARDALQAGVLPRGRGDRGARRAAGGRVA